MQLHTQSLFGGKAGETFPQLAVTGVFGVDAGVDLDPAVVVAVPFFGDPAQFLALLVGVKVKFFVFVDETVSRKGDVCLHAGFGNGFRSGIGEVIQIRYGGNAKPQALSDAHECGSFGAAAIHFGLQLQLGFQGLVGGQVVAVAPQSGGCQMGVAIDQAGQNDHARAVQDGLGLFLRGSFADVGDFSLVNGQVCAEENVHPFIHSNDGCIGDQQIQIRYRLSYPITVG